MKQKVLPHYTKAIIIVILSLLLVGCGGKNGGVSGIFVDRDGEPILETITVTLEPLKTFDDGRVGWSIEYVLTDEYRQRLQEMEINDGKFLFENVQPGPYWVRAKVPGYPINTSPAIMVVAGEVADFAEISANK